MEADPNVNLSMIIDHHALADALRPDAAICRVAQGGFRPSFSLCNASQPHSADLPDQYLCTLFVHSLPGFVASLFRDCSLLLYRTFRRHVPATSAKVGGSGL